MKMTATWLESRKEPRNRPRKRYDVTVDGREGLMARVHPSGAVSFRFRYMLGGKRCVMVLGEFGAGRLSLAEAFDAHHQAQRELEKDLDPLEERAKRLEARQRAREERSSAGTVAEIVEQFVHRKLRAERWDEALGKWVRDPKAKTKARKRPDKAAAMLGYPAVIERKGSGHKRVPTLLSEFGKLKARDLTRRQLVEFLDSVVDRGAPVGANRLYALLKQLFDWAAAKELLPASPMAGVERPGGQESARCRVLTTEEIRTFWTKLSDAVMVEPTRIALKLLLATGQRRGEVTFAKWSHFDLQRKTWTVPVALLKTSHTKRKTPEPHVVPLSPLAVELLQDLKRLTGTGTYLLPAHATPKRDAHYSEAVLSRAVRQNRKHFGIEAFTPHDLRRSAASHMTKLGVPRLHVAKVLGHAVADITAVYDRHDYLPEKRAALEKWAEHLRTILEGREQSVIPMVRRAS